jgi:electron transfer flavoprotein beta subunit
MTRTVAVLVRRIPDPDKLQMDRRTGKLLTEGVPFILNPVDRSALELALRLKDAHGDHVVALSADEPEADLEMREALAMGADEAVLLSDQAFSNDDPTMHANLFRLALERFVKADLVLAASRSTDHTWSTVGPQVAALLDWPLVIEAEEVEVEDSGALRALAHTGGRRARVETELPCVVSVARGVVRPRHPTSWGLAAAFDERDVDHKGLGDMGLEASELARVAPRTRVASLRLEKRERESRVWEGTPEEVGRILGRRLVDMGFAGRRQ